MSSGKKKHRAVIDIPELSVSMSEHSDTMRKALDIINTCCTNDCVYYDNGIGCHPECPVLDWYDALYDEEEKEEQEVLRSLHL